MTHYDFILAGGGAAGLGLAYQLAHSPLGHCSMLVVDKDPKDRNDHTWCSWIAGPAIFDDIAYRVWDRVRFVGENLDTIIPLAPYRYRMIRAIDYYRFVRQSLSARGNMDFRLGTVEGIQDGAEQVQVTVHGQTYTGSWAFDSRFVAEEFPPHLPGHQYLKQHFKGWEIETPQAAFDPQTPTLFDFRTPQHHEMRFFYILPFSEHRALVEYTLFSAELLPSAEYDHALRAYIGEVLGLADYRIVAEEVGNIPMTDHPFPRRVGQRVMTIGTRGGRVKPSTGYSFLRAQEDAAAIVQSLQEVGHPFRVPPDSRRYRYLDSVMLQVMDRQGHRMKGIFTDLFRHNPIDRLFRFLDERGSVWENVLIMTSVPPGPFLRAWLRLKVLRRV